jgi:hypothetical protein
MPRGIYKRKRKSKKGGPKRPLKSVGQLVAHGPEISTFAVEIDQRRRIVVYVRAHEVDDANMLAREYVYRQKKIVAPVSMPGVVIEPRGLVSRGVSIAEIGAYSPDSHYGKASEEPIQKVWAKDRSRSKKADATECAPMRTSYKIVPVRAK